MKLLYVTNQCPWPPSSGTRQRNYHLIRQLASRHEVRVVVLEGMPVDHPDVPTGTEFLQLDRFFPTVCTAESRWARAAGELSRAFGTLAPSDLARYSGSRFEEAFRRIRPLARAADLVWVSRAFWARQAVSAGWNRPLVVDYDDVTTLAEWSHVRHLSPGPHKLFSLLNVGKQYLFERRLARRVWRVVVCKEDDRRFFGAARNVRVVPNGTEPRPDLSAESTAGDRLLFVGQMGYEPNVDAAVWFADQCRPAVETRVGRPVRFDVVGGDPAPPVRERADGERVRVWGFVDSLTEHYRAADVVVVPMRKGSGTKLKVLEALAYGKAVVATGEAVRGYELQPGRQFLRADTPAEFADSCAELLGDPDHRRRLGRSGREWVSARYTWDRVGEILGRVVYQ